MSSFSGLSTALSSLIAQRQALNVSGQNIANANTVGYTRQRADLQSVSTAAVRSMFSTPLGAGTGVNTVGIARLGDEFLDARLRTQTSQSAHYASTATALQRVESVVTEPGDTGLASGMQQFWTAWEDVANAPDSGATRTALLGKATTLTHQIADTYRAFETQWQQARVEAGATVAQVNTAAQGIAELNNEIRGVLVSGGSANELIDHRSELITQLSSLVGATSRLKEDGTMDVMIAGNQLVTGDRAQTLQLEGSYVMNAAIAEPPVATDVVRLSWANTGTSLVLDGGSLAGTITSLSPASFGGPIATAVSTVNKVATDVAAAVNAVHSSAQTLAAPPNDTGVDFFSLTAGTPAALGLKVAITDPQQIAAANAANGPLDGSVADQISQLRDAAGGPDQTWRNFVVDLGVTTQATIRRADVSETSRAVAENIQRSNASVDIDEEMTNMLAYQRAYEGAARVLTAVDEMLDTLINRTGLVGR
ncbi:flagellar hook-associated protein FlgK [Demequina sp. TTPB684]|uniref:flagellar hook-associated protein FlgK n=1 Tax=unclassified Demequina TaxID=2620311 RepID=UPI001CF5791E|nr:MULTISPECIES: flagellar hook-associated protein FlgK [unclassified Demequina]MCB2411962.1 flagellar hook-associated protein FlgK [Demequina sp. TTPB684]UPU87906.1 flagellar hook-associated protein FlgK [Demequina sp. TMPB413]